MKLKLSASPRAVLLAIAAGFVTASVVTDIAPQVKESQAQLSAVIGVAVGVVVMLMLKQLEPSPCASHDVSCKKQGFPLALVAAVSVDMFLDGILIGHGLVTQKTSVAFTAAMAIEGLVLSSTIANVIEERGGTLKENALAFGMVGGSSLLGILLGHRIGGNLGGSGESLVLGATLSILLWIVIIELLPEAKEHNRTWWVPILWLVGMGGGLTLDWAIDKPVDDTNAKSL